MVSHLNFFISWFKLLLASFKLLSKDQPLVISLCLCVSLLQGVTRQSVCELHSDSQGFSLGHPAGWLEAPSPLWAVPRVADEGLKGLRRADPGPQTHKVTSGATPSSGMARLLTWSVTPCTKLLCLPFAPSASQLPGADSYSVSLLFFPHPFKTNLCTFKGSFFQSCSIGMGCFMYVEHSIILSRYLQYTRCKQIAKTAILHPFPSMLSHRVLQISSP